MKLSKKDISELSALEKEEYWREHYTAIRREDVNYWSTLAQGIADGLADHFPQPVAGTAEYYMVCSAQDLASWLANLEEDCFPVDLVVADLSR